MISMQLEREPRWKQCNLVASPMPPTPYKNTKIYREIEFSRFLNIVSFLLIKYGIPEVREVSRNLPGARGFAVIVYGPVVSHGDPIQARNYRFFEFANSVVM